MSERTSPPAGTSALRRAADALLDLLLPSVCPLCGLVAGPGLCPACRAEMLAPEHPCPLCAEPRRDDSSSCPTCGGIGIDRIADVQACLLYRGAIRALVRRAKSDAAAPALRALLDLAGPFRPEFRAGADEIVPVPRASGHGGGLDLPRGLARHLAGSHRLPLRRRLRATRRLVHKQQALGLLDRRRNVSGLYACAEDMRGRTVVLVDDILTTGATAGDAARALGRAGAREVRLYVLCRTPRHAPDPTPAKG